ncbi:MAG: FkbM family methyltransferase [Kiritimatiellia bacterium]|jgi:FkbM family methyltransferase
MSTITMSRPLPGCLVINKDGVPHEFRFPNTGNLESIVLKVLGGQEYPSLRLPGWKPATILDIGANIGATAVFFSLAYPEAKIWSWEPSPSTFAYLKSNTSWLPNVTCLEHGLFSHETSLRLYTGKAQCAQASVSVSIETRSDSYEDIRLVPAKKALMDKLSGPVLLKMDTEGCEIPVLRDLGDLIDKVDVVYLEYHSEKDRRAIDELLGERFQLWRAQADNIHRGTVAYIHERLVQRYPQLGVMEIPSPPSLAQVG